MFFTCTKHDEQIELNTGFIAFDAIVSMYFVFRKLRRYFSKHSTVSVTWGLISHQHSHTHSICVV